MVKVVGLETTRRRWLLMSDDKRDAIREELDELPFPPLTRALLQRRLMPLDAGKHSKAGIPIEVGPDDVDILASKIRLFRTAK